MIGQATEGARDDRRARAPAACRGEGTGRREPAEVPPGPVAAAASRRRGGPSLRPAAARLAPRRPAGRPRRQGASRRQPCAGPGRGQERRHVRAACRAVQRELGRGGGLGRAVHRDRGRVDGARRHPDERRDRGPERLDRPRRRPALRRERQPAADPARHRRAGRGRQDRLRGLVRAEPRRGDPAVPSLPGRPGPGGDLGGRARLGRVGPHDRRPRQPPEMVARRPVLPGPGRVGRRRRRGLVAVRHGRRMPHEPARGLREREVRLPPLPRHRGPAAARAGRHGRRVRGRRRLPDPGQRFARRDLWLAASSGHRDGLGAPPPGLPGAGGRPGDGRGVRVLERVGRHRHGDRAEPGGRRPPVGAGPGCGRPRRLGRQALRRDAHRRRRAPAVRPRRRRLLPRRRRSRTGGEPRRGRGRAVVGRVLRTARAGDACRRRHP